MQNKLAQIAVCTARTAKSVVGMEPKVAMLSFSTKGSAKHEVVDKVIEAVKIAHEMDPDLALDGELQADAALVPEVGASKAPGSAIAGNANVLVVPSLEVGNISYKLVQRLGHADAVGPIFAGYCPSGERLVTWLFHRRCLSHDCNYCQPGYCSKESKNNH